jgi:hypothetical protein
VVVPRSFTRTKYKSALADPLNKTAKEGWEHLIRHGVPEPEVFEAVKLAVSNDLESLRSSHQRTRLETRQVRALGKQLRKNAELLERVIAQYPDLLPARVEALLIRELATERVGGEHQVVPSRWEPFRETQLATRHLPALLKAVSERLAECRAKASADGGATARKGRVALGPNIPAGLYMLHLFDRAAAGLCSPEPGVRFNSPAAELPMPPRAEKRHAWTCALLNLACQLAGYSPTFDADNLRKWEEERSPEQAVSEP